MSWSSIARPKNSTPKKLRAIYKYKNCQEIVTYRICVNNMADSEMAELGWSFDTEKKSDE